VGSNHRSPAYQAGAFPLDHGTVQLRRPDSNRRRAAYETALGTNSSPLRSDQGGSRTHKHQALDLTAIPVRVPGRPTSGDGGSRTHTLRLLRPLPLPVGLHHQSRGPWARPRSSPSGNRTPPLGLRTRCPADRRTDRQCAGQESNLPSGVRRLYRPPGVPAPADAFQ
jgi:hypothetical protein